MAISSKVAGGLLSQITQAEWTETTGNIQRADGYKCYTLKHNQLGEYLVTINVNQPELVYVVEKMTNKSTSIAQNIEQFISQKRRPLQYAEKLAGNKKKQTHFFEDDCVLIELTDNNAYKEQELAGTDDVRPIKEGIRSFAFEHASGGELGQVRPEPGFSEAQELAYQIAINNNQEVAGFSPLMVKRYLAAKPETVESLTLFNFKGKPQFFNEMLKDLHSAKASFSEDVYAGTVPARKPKAGKVYKNPKYDPRKAMADILEFEPRLKNTQEELLESTIEQNKDITEHFYRGDKTEAIEWLETLLETERRKVTPARYAASQVAKPFYYYYFPPEKKKEILYRHFDRIMSKIHEKKDSCYQCATKEMVESVLEQNDDILNMLTHDVAGAIASLLPLLKAEISKRPAPEKACSAVGSGGVQINNSVDIPFAIRLIRRQYFARICQAKITDPRMETYLAEHPQMVQLLSTQEQDKKNTDNVTNAFVLEMINVLSREAGSLPSLPEPAQVKSDAAHVHSATLKLKAGADSSVAREYPIPTDEQIEAAYEAQIVGKHIASDDIDTLKREAFFTPRLVHNLLNLKRDEKGRLAQESQLLIHAAKKDAVVIINRKGENLEGVKQQLRTRLLQIPSYETKQRAVDIALENIGTRRLFFRYKNGDNQDQARILEDFKDEIRKIEEENKVYFTDQMKRNALLTQEAARQRLLSGNYSAVQMMMRRYTSVNGVVDLEKELWYLGINFQNLIDHVHAKCFIVEIPVSFCDQIYAFITLRRLSQACEQHNCYKGIKTLEACDCYSILNNHLVLATDFKKLCNIRWADCSSVNKVEGEGQINVLCRIMQHRRQQQRLMVPYSSIQLLTDRLSNFRNRNLSRELMTVFGVSTQYFLNRINPVLLYEENHDFLCRQVYDFMWLDSLMKQSPSLHVFNGISNLLSFPDLIDSVNAGFFEEEKREQRLSAFQDSKMSDDLVLKFKYDKTDSFKTFSQADLKQYNLVWGLLDLIKDLRGAQLSPPVFLPTVSFAFNTWTGNCNINAGTQIILRTTPLRVIHNVISDFTDKYTDGRGRWLKGYDTEQNQAQITLLYNFQALLQEAGSILYGGESPKILSEPMYEFVETLRWLKQLNFTPLKGLREALAVEGIDSIRQDDVFNILDGIPGALNIKEHPDIGYRDVTIETANYFGVEYVRVNNNIREKESVLYVRQSYVADIARHNTEAPTLKRLLDFNLDSDNEKEKTKIKSWDVVRAGGHERRLKLKTNKSKAVVVRDLNTYAGIKFSLSVNAESRTYVNEAIISEIDKKGPVIKVDVPVVIPVFKNGTLDYYEKGNVKARVNLIGFQRGEGAGHYFVVSVNSNGGITVQDDTKDLTLKHYRQSLPDGEFSKCTSIIDIINLGYTPVLLSTVLLPETYKGERFLSIYHEN